MKENRRVFWRMFALVKPHKHWIFFSSMSAIINVGCSIFGIYLMKQAIDSALKAKLSELAILIALSFILMGIGVPSQYLSRYATGRLGVCSTRDLQKYIMNHIKQLPVSYLEQNHSGDMVSRLTNDITVFQNFMTNSFSNLLFYPLMFICSFIYMLIINPYLFLISIALIPIGLFMTNTLSKQIKGLSREYQEKLAKSNCIIQDILGGVDIIKAFNLENVMCKKAENQLEDVLDTAFKVEKRKSILQPASIIMNEMPYVSCIMFGGYMAIQGRMEASSLIAYIQLLRFLIQPLSLFSNLIGDLRSAIGAIERLFNILDSKLVQTEGYLYSGENSDDAIEFIDVKFGYSGKRHIFNDISFKVPKGKLIALVGPSGSGKSTIFNLICCFYDLESGCIKLNGSDIKSWSSKALYSQLSLVSQDAYLFPGTIYENIRYGNLDATEEDVIAASKAAEAHSFIIGMSDGYNAQVGERGVKLSGGQRQRITIARAILKNSPILLLDEPTSSLDYQSEVLVCNAIQRIRKNHTVLVIAHRLSTIKNADEIIVIDNGCVAERGTHEQLICIDGLYKQLFFRQFLDSE